ncbi:MAG: penicillin acylase family protein [Emcibacter sp.]|nr:penicillin acylase family protein [Emcibacter sp.]
MTNRSRLLINLYRLLLGVVVLLFLTAGGLYFFFRSSLPILEGNIKSATIQGHMAVERDENGNATLIADNRLDLAYGTGFVHGQERFFQMDLSRRMAAGELSELFGTLALDMDKRNRLHRFRTRAKWAFDHMAEDHKNLMYHYVAGINDGLKTLGSKPFEYWLLGQEPRPWTVEDSFLVIYSMYFALQGGNIEVDLQKYFLEQSLDQRLVNFLLPSKTEWDAPLQLDATPWTAQEIPSVDALSSSVTELAFLKNERNELPGSNNWAVSGKMTKTGAAMLSNDMHLGISAPSTWFRLRLKLSDQSLDISGVSLPGTPLIIAGSNGSVAWGYTNSFVDTADLVALTINPDNPDQYKTKNGYENFSHYDEIIKIKDAEDITITVKETIWGPVMDIGIAQKFAVQWTAHHWEAVNMGLMAMEKVENVRDIMKIAPTFGIPTQNAMLTDRQGNIGWIHFGALPRRKSGDYSKPSDWSESDMGWDGWLNFDEYPKIYNPENNRLWSANSRVVSGADYAKVGDGGTDIGARQHQIRDNLMALDKEIVEGDLYAIQMDNRAIFWDRWQKQLLIILNNSSDSRLKLFIPPVENWGGRADIASVGFRLVKNYRQMVYRGMMGYLTKACTDKFDLCNYNKATNQMESPLWRLVDVKPLGWLPPEYHDDWQVFFEAMAYKAWEPVMKGEIPLRDYIWGEENRAEIKHPLSKAVPLLSLITDMPENMQNGVHEKMPHIAGHDFGQSERIVVSPGHEQDGVMNIPAGQSGHPLSPYYGAGHKDWLEGNMTPFLPGATKYSLQFSPLK